SWDQVGTNARRSSLPDLRVPESCCKIDRGSLDWPPGVGLPPPVRSEVRMERRHYRNPPIAEATCELKFVPGPEWDAAFYIALLQRLRSEYGGKVRRQHVMEAGLLSGSEQTQPTMTMKQGQSRWQDRKSTRLNSSH